jgi:hypothetical protein
MTRASEVGASAMGDSRPLACRYAEQSRDDKNCAQSKGISTYHSGEGDAGSKYPLEGNGQGFFSPNRPRNHEDLPHRYKIHPPCPVR